MGRAKETLKWLIVHLCGPRLQHRIRRLYLVRQVVGSTDFHEPEMAVLKALIDSGDSAVDIGANVGAYTKELSLRVGEHGRVAAFEPVATNHDILQSVVRKARLRNVDCFRMALGAKAEQREIAIPDLGGFTGYYWAHFARPGEVGETVEVSTLDEMWRQGAVRRPDFIKCDVEGSELEVLQGSAELLRSEHPTWLIEVSRDTSDAVFAFLHSCGYQAFVYTSGLVPTAAYRDREFSNYFFLHPESKAWNRVEGAVAGRSNA